MNDSRVKKVASQLGLVVAGSAMTVLLLGGGPAGAFNVPNNSVTSAKIVNGTIQGMDIKDGTVAPVDLAPRARPLWARVGQSVPDISSFELIRGRGVTSVGIFDGGLGDTWYVVTFDRPVDDCGWTATPNANAANGEVDAAWLGVSEEGSTEAHSDLRVSVYDESNLASPLGLGAGDGFTLVVHC